MKCIINILFFCSGLLMAQNTKPIGFASSDYGISQNSKLYNASVYFDPSGKLQICAFGGGISFRENLKEVAVERPLVPFKKFSKIYFDTQTQNEWIISTNQIDVLNKNKLLVTKKVKFKSVNKTFFKNNSLFYVDFDKQQIANFNGKNVKILNQFTESIQNSDVFFNSQNNTIYFVVYFQDRFDIYQEQQTTFKKIATIKAQYEFDLEVICISNDHLFYYAKPNKAKLLNLVMVQEKSEKIIGQIPYHTRFQKNFLLISTDYGLFDFCKIDDDKIIKIASVNIPDGVRNFQFDEKTNALYVGTNNKPIRLFLHLTNYPRLFHGINSSSIFAIAENEQGHIYASTYQGGIAILNNNKAEEINLKTFFPISGSFRLFDKMYFFDLSNVISVARNKKIEIALAKHQGYFGYVTRDKKSIYLALNRDKGLYVADAKSVYNNNASWTAIDSTKGFRFEKIYTICEDNKSRIWCGSPENGIGIYDPKTTKTQFIDKKKINDFGPIASVSDNRGGIWLGGYDSKLMYTDGNKNNISTLDLQRISHPLLEGKNRIMSMCIYKKWLVLGAYDKILLLDLNAFYDHKKTIIRYLNPTETNFTSFLEQNSMLVSKTDNVWFSTSDNLYEFDVKKWLTLPTYSVTPKIVITKNKLENTFEADKKISFKATESSFDIDISFQTPDNMPRYLNGVLTEQDEKPIFDTPNLQTKFQFKNLPAGDYDFYVRICQHDGSFTVNKFPIEVHKFFWQKWWFWCLMAFFPLAFLWYYNNKKQEIELQKKRLTQLNLTSLSNQFRPHFMLNALNSISSQLHDKPHAEKVITRLGDSINILYGFTQKNEFTHIFENEWKLVLNNIDIQKLLFIPELTIEIIKQDLIPNDYKLPVGILQIPVENALLHGLRNKSDKDCKLQILFSEDESNYYVSITDNGVGREKSAAMNNFKRNGNGLKTVLEMIKIINSYQSRAIKFEIVDHTNPLGTQVNIKLFKKINYEKIKL